jgi:FtsP/CotA-like multicopper oxidase with cupredoxin domain
MQRAAAASAIMIAARCGASALADPEYSLEVRPGAARLLEDQSLQTATWGYDGEVPGPVLRAQRGRPITVNVTNRLDQPTSVHWHGLRIENAMDGVPGLTQPAIAPGETFVYRFTPPDAGTFWYHPHIRSWEQVARGLYGALVVEEDASPDVDRDFVLAADDWRLGDDGAFDEDSLGNLHDWAHAGRLGNVLTINGKAYERLTVAPGERVRLRLINTANARVLRFAVPGLRPWIVAHDGQPVRTHLLGDEGVELSPGQRTDLIVDIAGSPGDEIPIVELSTGNRLVAGNLVLADGASPPPRPFATPSSLPANAAEVPATGQYHDVNLTMTGGAMRFLQSAVYKGETVDGRTLALEHGQAWAFNGVAGMPAAPLFKVPRGTAVRLKLRNDTGWPHNIHMHGHHFVELARHDSSTEDAAPVNTVRADALQDTILLQADERSEIALLADNPGKWMIHCHMLEHQASGMATWFEVI